MSRRIRKKKSSQLETRLEGYAQAAGSLLHVVRTAGARKLVPMTTAAGAALAMAPAADATIVYVANQNFDLPLATGPSYDTARLDLDNAGAATDVQLAFTYNMTAMTSYANISALTTVQGIFTTGGPFNAAANLSSGASIGPGGNIAYATTGPTGTAFRTLNDFYGTTGFAGVVFNIGGQPHYAWLRIQVNGAGDFLTIIDWAYEDQANTPIAAGAVPEPGSGALVGLGLLALGARGVRHRRKRLAEIAKADEAPAS
jgi:hypothetical protein